MQQVVNPQMNDAQRNWLEERVERVAIMTQDNGCPESATGMYWCSECSWDAVKLKALVPLLKEHGFDDGYVDAIRAEYKRWKMAR